MRETCQGIFLKLKNFTKLPTLSASGGFKNLFAYMLNIPKSLYDLQEYFRFSQKKLDHEKCVYNIKELYMKSL